MPILVPQNVRGLTYKQDSEPDEPLSGDSWYDTRNGGVYVFYESKWHNIIRPDVGHGYYVGGKLASGNYTESGRRITFPFDSGSPDGAFTASYAHTTGSGVNSSLRGYFIGGAAQSAPTPTGDPGDMMSTYIEYLEFLFDSGGATLKNDSQGYGYAARWGAAGFNSSIEGFVTSGDGSTPFSGSPSLRQDTEKIVFPFTGTQSTIGLTSSANTIARYQTVGCNSSNAGYLMGGASGSPWTAGSTNFYGLYFPMEGQSAINVSLGNTIQGAAAFNSSLNGYHACGTIAATEDRIGRISFPLNATGALNYFTLSVRTNPSGMNSSEVGYILGGGFSAPTTVEKYNLSLDELGQVVNGASIDADRAHPTTVDTTDFVSMFV